LARSWLAPVELFVVIAMAGAVHSSSAADLPRLPLLQFVEQALRLPSARPSAGLKAKVLCDIDGGAYGLTWTGEDELVAVSSLPEWSVMETLRFVHVGPSGQARVIGDYDAGRIGSPSLAILRQGGHLACVAVDWDDSRRRAPGAVELDAEAGEVRRLEAPGDLLAAVRWQSIDQPDSDFYLDHGPVTVYDGRGHVVAEGALPPGLFLVWQWVPAIWQANGELGVALQTVRDEKLLDTNELPPCDLSLLAVPTPGGGVCRLLEHIEPSADFAPATIPAEAKLRSWWHGLMAPAVDAVGNRVSFREKLEAETRDEKLVLRRLWVLDRASGERTLACTIAEYMGPGHSYRFEVGADGAVSERWERSDVWSGHAELISALSPDGKRLAYSCHGQLRLVTLP